MAISTDWYFTHGTSRRCTVRGTVLWRAVGSVLASHCHMRTVNFELILCRQQGEKFLLVIELSGFPAIHQSTVGTISDCVYLCVCGGGGGEGVSAAQRKFRGGGMITKKISKRIKKTGTLHSKRQQSLRDLF